MNTEITLKRIETFEAFSGGNSLGIFKVESEWNGLTKMVSGKEIMIVHRKHEPINQMFGMDENARIVQATPSIFNQIIRS